MTPIGQALSRADQLGRAAGIEAAKNGRPEAPALTSRNEGEMVQDAAWDYDDISDAEVERLYAAWTGAAEGAFERARHILARLWAAADPGDYLTFDDDDAAARAELAEVVR